MNRQGQVALCQALHSVKGLQGPHLQACAASQHWQSRQVLKAMYRCHMLQVLSLKATALSCVKAAQLRRPASPWLRTSSLQAAAADMVQHMI